MLAGETGPPPGLVEGCSAHAVREYTFEFKAAFWMVAAFTVVTFTVVTFALWMALPADHRALPVLERSWPGSRGWSSASWRDEPSPSPSPTGGRGCCLPHTLVGREVRRAAHDALHEYSRRDDGVGVQLPRLDDLVDLGYRDGRGGSHHGVEVT